VARARQQVQAPRLLEGVDRWRKEAAEAVRSVALAVVELQALVAMLLTVVKAEAPPLAAKAAVSLLVVKAAVSPRAVKAAASPRAVKAAASPRVVKAVASPPAARAAVVR